MQKQGGGDIVASGLHSATHCVVLASVDTAVLLVREASCLSLQSRPRIGDGVVQHRVGNRFGRAGFARSGCERAAEIVPRPGRQCRVLVALRGFNSERRCGCNADIDALAFTRKPSMPRPVPAGAILAATTMSASNRKDEGTATRHKRPSKTPPARRIVRMMPRGRTPIRSLSVSVSMLSMASPHGASVIPRPMMAIPYRFAAHGRAKLHQY